MDILTVGAALGGTARPVVLHPAGAAATKSRCRCMGFLVVLPGNRGVQGLSQPAGNVLSASRRLNNGACPQQTPRL